MKTATHTPVSNTIIACRVPTMFCQNVQEFCTKNDITVSQLIRKGIREIIGQDKPAMRDGWSVTA